MKVIILISSLVIICHGATISKRIRDIPDSIDWNALGKVTPVIDESVFNHSSEIYNSVGALESRSSIQSNGDLIPFSIQQIADCAALPPYGQVEEVYKYIQKNGGIDTAASYPEISNQNAECLFSKGTIGGTVNGYVVVPEGDEDALKAAVAEGPVAVIIDASQESFAEYTGGVYYEKKCVPGLLDHDVIVVGYGTEDGQDFWLVKNSWGSYWGLNGYIKMARNRDNNCNIASHAVYPVL